MAQLRDSRYLQQCGVGVGIGVVHPGQLRAGGCEEVEGGCEVARENVSGHKARRRPACELKKKNDVCTWAHLPGYAGTKSIDII